VASQPRADSPAARLVKGMLAGVAGALAMNVANHRGSPSGHGAQTQKPSGPPGTRDAALDPVEKALPMFQHDPVSLWRAGTAGHYAIGAACGAAYGILKRKPDAAVAATGSAFGIAVWILLDQVALPLLGLSRSPERYPARLHARTLALHLLFGAVTAAAYKLASRLDGSAV